MNIEQLPKVELHLHLDCSLSYAVVSQIDPSITLEKYNAEFIAPPKCEDLRDYLTRAPSSYPLMQTPEHLRLVVLDLFEQLQKDNVIYAELRFAPCFTPRVAFPCEKSWQAWNLRLRNL
jgi:adenosine deaminase